MPTTLGLDIGGANLKAADDDDHAVSVPFALWQNPAGLAAALGELCTRFEPADRLAVTMTGELCDCFETKAEGVSHILDAVEQIAGERPIWVWQTSGEFVDPSTAREFWQLTAAANWHATATFVGRCVPEGPGLLIDIGSTTTDLIPIEDGVPAPAGRTDFERLCSEELLYWGVGRTPVEINVTAFAAGARVALPPERFATMRDVYLVLRRVPEAPADRDTADGRPATWDHALGRLARAVCCDRTELSDEQIVVLAKSMHEQLCLEIKEAAMAVGGVPAAVIYAGSGAFLADEVHQTTTLEAAEKVLIADLFSPEVSACLPAHAVARLCAERC
ncbi:hydantoinase/oxoprolinase family protein [Alienimonas chondri]|uniref:Hydantoinase A/oxoprolinase domain-containing protein n=1 Tax=Alienimonas chondri TaxID=2681879 RepID=A0ABX1VIV5_9PLAN|nr:hydantoinase/oxoprolinase family protein [Alienimonas chondri]NNJ27843.1 hypothetical protein [Alienimonas chondri]